MEHELHSNNDSYLDDITNALHRDDDSYLDSIIDALHIDNIVPRQLLVIILMSYQ